MLLQSKKKSVGCITIHNVQGAQDLLLIGQYFSNDVIICVVNDPKLDVALDSIASVACTGTKCDGNVFVTTVDDALDICTKKHGTTPI